MIKYVPEMTSVVMEEIPDKSFFRRVAVHLLAGPAESRLAVACQTIQTNYTHYRENYQRCDVRYVCIYCVFSKDVMHPSDFEKYADRHHYES